MKMTQFSGVYEHNPATTRRPVICQFAKNGHSINSIFPRLYKNYKKLVTFSMTGSTRTLKHIPATPFTAPHDGLYVIMGSSGRQ